MPPVQSCSWEADPWTGSTHQLPTDDRRPIRGGYEESMRPRVVCRTHAGKDICKFYILHNDHRGMVLTACLIPRISYGLIWRVDIY